MCEFIHYKYKPTLLDHIDYNNKLKNYLYNFSKNEEDINNLILYGPNGSCKKTFLNCYLNNYFKNDNSIYKTNTFDYTLSNNYKIHYKSSTYHYQVSFLDNYKNNILIIHELVNYLIKSKSILNNYTIIILHNIHKLNNHTNLLKNIMEKYYNVKFLCSSLKRHNELEIAIQLRTEKLSEFELLKIALIINKKENLQLNYINLIKIIKDSDNNIHMVLNSLQSIINNKDDSLILLNNICKILEKKNVLDYPEIKQLLNKIIIFNSYNLYFIIHYIYNKIIYLIKNKNEFIAYISTLKDTNNNIVKNIITLDTYIFYIYKMIK